MPHFPYYFNAEGKLNARQTLVGSQYMYNKELYLGYLQFVNRKVISLMKEIIRFDKDAVILLLSDHGYRYAEDNRYLFSNLLAIYQSRSEIPLSDTLRSNVNVFRWLFNNSFKTQLPLLLDKKFK